MTNALVCANLCFVFETFGRYTQKGIHKMRKTVPFKIVLLFTIFIMLLTGCKARDQKSADQNVESADKQQEETSLDTASQKKVQKNVFAMDTYMTVTAYGENAGEAVDAAIDEINRLDALLSTGKDTSQVALINKNKSAVLTEDTQALLKKSLELYESTGHRFDITIYPVMCLWGFPTEEYRVPQDDEIMQTLNLVGSDKLMYKEETNTLTLRDGMAIDFGGIAKGYTSSKLMDIFRKYGVSSAMVSLGGNVQVLGTKTDGSDWRVAVQNPDGTDDYLGVLAIKDKAVITSGGYERYFEQDGKTYHHIMDNETGKPADSDLISVTIVSEDGTLADGLSTALFVMGKKEALEYWKKHSEEFDAILVTKDGEITVTQGLADSFSSERNYDITER